MPELADREKREAALSLALAGVLDRERARMETLLGDRPNTANVPPEYWNAMQSSLTLALYHDLQAAYVQAANQQAGLLDFSAPPADVLRDAMAWARQQAAVVSIDFVANTKRKLQDAIYRHYQEERARESEAVAALGLVVLSDSIANLFGAGRAEGAAVTGVTSAQTAGERGLIGRYEIETGVRMQAIWHAERNACKICAALHGHPQDRWPARFASGPPSPHPNCRCSLRWVRFFPSMFSSN